MNNIISEVDKIGKKCKGTVGCYVTEADHPVEIILSFPSVFFMHRCMQPETLLSIPYCHKVWGLSKYKELYIKRPCTNLKVIN